MVRLCDSAETKCSLRLCTFQSLCGFSPRCDIRRVRPHLRMRTNTSSNPPDLFRGFLHCYDKNIYGTRPVAREFQHGLVRYYRGPDNPPLGDTVGRFLTDPERVINGIFDSGRGAYRTSRTIPRTATDASGSDARRRWPCGPALTAGLRLTPIRESLSSQSHPRHRRQSRLPVSRRSRRLGKRRDSAGCPGYSLLSLSLR